MADWTPQAVLARAQDRGVFFVSRAPGAAGLRGLCAQLVRDGRLAAAGRRGEALVYYPVLRPTAPPQSPADPTSAGPTSPGPTLSTRKATTGAPL